MWYSGKSADTAGFIVQAHSTLLKLCQWMCFSKLCKNSVLFSKMWQNSFNLNGQCITRGRITLFVLPFKESFVHFCLLNSGLNIRYPWCKVSLRLWIFESCRNKGE